MSDERGGSWPVTAEKVGAVGAQPNPLRRLTVPRQALKDAFGRPWRVAIRAIVAGDNDVDPDALAAASGYTSFGDSQSAILSKEMPNDYIYVVEQIVFRPVSELGNEYLKIVLTDGGHANDTTPTIGRRGDVIGYDIPLPVDGSGVVPVYFQAAGGGLLRLWCQNTDPVVPQAVDAEMRGMAYQAEQFRATAPGRRT